MFSQGYPDSMYHWNCWVSVYVSTLITLKWRYWCWFITLAPSVTQLKLK